MRFRDLSPALRELLTIRKAEVATFGTLNDADRVAAALHEKRRDFPDYEIITCAAGRYYVFIISPDIVGDTDVTNANP